MKTFKPNPLQMFAEKKSPDCENLDDFKHTNKGCNLTFFLASFSFFLSFLLIFCDLVHMYQCKTFFFFSFLLILRRTLYVLQIGVLVLEITF